MTTLDENVGPVATGSERGRLLQSIVDVARAIFDAGASSIFLLDETERFLVFAAVSGAGSRTLVGKHLPAAEGIAGSVLASRQPLAVRDLLGEPRFARGFAESTGYLPNTILAAPLLSADRAVGVLEVLDHSTERTRMLGDLDLLALFADQATVALELLRQLGAGRGERPDAVGTALTEISRVVTARGPRHEQVALRLLTAVHEMLVAQV
jgi:GAF domain-containing protein